LRERLSLPKPYCSLLVGNIGKVLGLRLEVEGRRLDSPGLGLDSLGLGLGLAGQCPFNVIAKSRLNCMGVRDKIGDVD